MQVFCEPKLTIPYITGLNAGVLRNQLIKTLDIEDFTKTDVKSFNKSQKLKSYIDIDKFSIEFIREYFIKNNIIEDSDKCIRFQKFIKFIYHINDLESDGDDGYLQRKIIRSKMIEKSSIKDFSIEEILQFLSIIFLEKFFNLEGYGGAPWSNIAKHALSFAKGEIIQKYLLTKL